MSSRKQRKAKQKLVDDSLPLQAPPDDSAVAPLKLRIVIVALVLTVSAVLLFARLGFYALWEDESLTALPALNLWRTGDTSLVFGRNIMAHRQGAMMTDMHERSYQPLMFYLAAPSLGLFGRNAWAARLPFAICGLATVALMLRWVWREQVRSAPWVLITLALMGNVSFYLYCRNCRYYAPGILFSVAIAYIYRFYDGRRRSVVALALLSLALLATNLIYYVALYTALLVDYVIWGRKRRPLAVSDWIWLLLPQVLLGLPLLLVWNPWKSQILDFLPHENWFRSKAILLYRNFRDLNRCEFGVLPLIALSPLLYYWVRWNWLLRAPVAIAVYIAIVTIISPQPISLSSTADIRYLVPVIPLGIAGGVLALNALVRQDVLLATALGMVAFGSNILSLDPFISGRARSTICDFIGELSQPPDDPFSVASAWINAHVAPERSVCVLPLIMTYPLMFHTPGPIYAWQLPAGSEDRFKGLEPIHFWGKVAPDYFVAFGPSAEDLSDATRPDAPIRYELVETLDMYWRDAFRPELFWRTFRPIAGYDRNRDAIYVFRRAKPPVIGLLRGQ